MKRPRNKAERAANVIELWTHSQAQRALPYIRSVVKSLREHCLEATRHRLHARRLAARPGRPNRETLIAQEQALQDACRAEGAFHDALEELQTLDVYCLDPAQGLALIPFGHQNELAWFVFDLFQKGGLATWRLNKDPLETRRPISEAFPETGKKALA